LRGSFVGRPDQPLRPHTRGEKTADEPQQPSIGHPLGQPHQNVVVDPVKELFQVDIHYPAVSRCDVLLCPRHRLMRGATGTEAEARLGERRVPVRLQRLQHRLLDEAIEHRRDTEGANAPAGFGISTRRTGCGR
jgi:site-specific DNA recombinase